MNITLATVQDSLKQNQMDVWTSREHLCLASAVSRNGEQNWPAVSRTLRLLTSESDHPVDWYSTKNCALQYDKLLEQIETPKRKREKAESQSNESQGETLLKVLNKKRVEELETVLEEERATYNQIRNEIQMLESNICDQSRLQQFFEEILQEQEREDKEEQLKKVKLKEREEHLRILHSKQTSAFRGALAVSPQKSKTQPQSTITLNSPLTESSQEAVLKPLTSNPSLVSGNDKDTSSNSSSTSWASLEKNSVIVPPPTNSEDSNSVESLKSTENEGKISPLDETEKGSTALSGKVIEEPFSGFTKSDEINPSKDLLKKKEPFDKIEPEHDAFKFEDTDAESSAPAKFETFKSKLQENKQDSLIKEIIKIEVPSEDETSESSTEKSSLLESLETETKKVNLKRAAIEEYIETPKRSLRGHTSSPAPQQQLLNTSSTNSPKEINVETEQAQQQEDEDLDEASSLPTPSVKKGRKRKFMSTAHREDKKSDSSSSKLSVPKNIEDSSEENSSSASDILLVQNLDLLESKKKDEVEEKTKTKNKEAKDEYEFEDDISRDSTDVKDFLQSRADRRKHSIVSVGDNICSPVVSESTPSSPASTNYGDDPEGEKLHRQWKKAMTLVWNDIAGHKNASIFLKPITADKVPGYQSVVFRPMDLQTIKRNMDNGITRTTNDFQRDVMLMLLNAKMYNTDDHHLYQMADEMLKDSVEIIEEFINAQAQSTILETPQKTLRRETRESSSKRVEEKKKEEIVEKPTKRRKI